MHEKTGLTAPSNSKLADDRSTKLGRVEPSDVGGRRPFREREIEKSELVFAFTRAQGTVLRPFRRLLVDALRRAGYYTVDVKLNWLLVQAHPMNPEINALPRWRRDGVIMRLGDDFRAGRKRGDALGLLGVKAINSSRAHQIKEASEQNRNGIAWIVRPLVHRDEVRLFRRIYGPRFFLISVSEPRGERLTTLIRTYRDDELVDFLTEEEARDAAEQTLSIDAGDQSPDPLAAVVAPRNTPKQYRLNVEGTFHLGDLFASVTQGVIEARSQAKIGQLVAQILDYPFSTPDLHEAGMAYAYQARISSASLGRQVGAAILTPAGELLATGWNDVPAPSGGLYTQHYSNLPFLRDLGIRGVDSELDDFRDHVEFTNARNGEFVTVPAEGMDAESIQPEPHGESNVRIRTKILADVLERLVELNVVDRQRLTDFAREKWLVSDFPNPADGIVDRQAESDWFIECAAALTVDSGFTGSDFNAIMEYGRSVHAEMHAITTAARLGISLKGSFLYCTTFPCHECARHIIATGIARVVYVEPYPKSRVFELHSDAVQREDGTPPAPLAGGILSPRHKRLTFAPFIGISPRRHEQLFAMTRRKYSDQASHFGRPIQGARETWELAEWEVGLSPVRSSLRGPETNRAVVELHEAQYLERLGDERAIADIISINELGFLSSYSEEET